MLLLDVVTGGHVTGGCVTGGCVTPGGNVTSVVVDCQSTARI